LNDTNAGYVGTLGYHVDSSRRYYVRARVYDPVTGRWYTVDPLWPDESAYGYVKSAPFITVDYTGLQGTGCPVHGGIPGCFFNGPPGSNSDPAYWKCQAPYPHSEPDCYSCLDAIYRRTGKAYKGSRGWKNAMRHCVGTCLANQECGSSCAEMVILHELPTFLSDDSWRDRNNNNVGHGIGRKRPNVNCHIECGKALKDGRLL